MIRTLLLYDGRMSSAERIADRLCYLIGSAKACEISEAPEDLTPYDGFCFVFNFYGAVSAGKTQAYILNHSDALRGRRVVMAGIGFSDLGYTKYVSDSEKRAGLEGFCGIFISSETETLRSGYEISRILREPENELPEHDLRSRIAAYITSHGVLALATAGKGFLRCTPMNYEYGDGAFYVPTEGGHTFRGVLENGNGCAAIFDTVQDASGTTRSLRFQCKAVTVTPGSGEYYTVLGRMGLTREYLDNMPVTLFLLKLLPQRYEYLDTSLPASGFDAKQYLDTDFRRKNQEDAAAFASAEEEREREQEEQNRAEEERRRAEEEARLAAMEEAAPTEYERAAVAGQLEPDDVQEEAGKVVREIFTEAYGGDGEDGDGEDVAPAGLPEGAAGPTATQAGAPGTDSTAEQAGIPGTDSTAAQAGIPGTGFTAEQAGIPGRDSTAAQAGIPGTDSTAAQAGIPGTGFTAEQAGIPGTDSTAAQAGVPGTGSTAEQAGIPGTDFTLAQAGATAAASAGSQTGIPSAEPVLSQPEVPGADPLASKAWTPGTGSAQAGAMASGKQTAPVPGNASGGMGSAEAARPEAVAAEDGKKAASAAGEDNAELIERLRRLEAKKPTAPEINFDVPSFLRSPRIDTAHLPTIDMTVLADVDETEQGQGVFTMRDEEEEARKKAERERRFGLAELEAMEEESDEASERERRRRRRFFLNRDERDDTLDGDGDDRIPDGGGYREELGEASLEAAPDYLDSIDGTDWAEGREERPAPDRKKEREKKDQVKNGRGKKEREKNGRGKKPRNKERGKKRPGGGGLLHRIGSGIVDALRVEDDGFDGEPEERPARPRDGRRAGASPRR